MDRRNHSNSELSLFIWAALLLSAILAVGR
jgi:hypothetical protein